MTPEAISQSKKMPGFLECADLVISSITDAGKLSDSIPLALFEHPQRKTLSVKNSKLSDGQIRRLLDLCPNLASLDVSGVLSVQDETVKYALKQCPQLQELNLTNCRKLTDDTLKHIDASSNRLTVLKIGGAFNMTSAGITAFVCNSKNIEFLKELSFSGVEFNSNLVCGLSTRCSSMVNLGISYCNLDDAMLYSILKPWSDQLESLCISWNSNLVSTDILELLSTFPKLSHLDLNGLKCITVPLLQDFFNKRYAQVTIYYT